jgi:hypothetical protein
MLRDVLGKNDALTSAFRNQVMKLLLSLNERKRPQVSMYRRGEPVLYCFDLLWMNGRPKSHP